MLPSTSTDPARARPQPAIELLRRRFEREGYLCLRSVVPAEPLARLSSEIVAKFEEDAAAGRLFDGGGRLSGHLNCFPGARSRFVHQALKTAGILELVQALSKRPLREPNIGCNLNLPGSHAQNEHIDGLATEPFLIVNVAVVDTTLENGAMEILAGSQRQEHEFWEVLLTRRNRRRVKLLQGDVVIRVSTLWHRGMPNCSTAPRPMLAFTWEDGGSPLVDPYTAHQGNVTLLPNRFRTDWGGRLKERAFVAAPRLGTLYQAARSLLGNCLL